MAPSSLQQMNAYAASIICFGSEIFPGNFPGRLPQLWYSFPSLECRLAALYNQYRRMFTISICC